MEQEQRPRAEAAHPDDATSGVPVAEKNTLPDDLDPRTAALASAVIDVDRFLGSAVVADARWFALMGSARLLSENPALASVLGDEAALLLAGDELHLTSIELDEVPSRTDPLASLEELAWPGDVDGLAVAFTLDAEHIRERRTDPQRPSAGMRGVVAALPDGTTFSAVQQDGQDHLALGPALIPEVSAALVDALSPTDPD